MPLLDPKSEVPPEPSNLDSTSPEVVPDVVGAGLRSLDDHRQHLLGLVETLRPFGINLLDAAGLTLCESIVSDLDLPTYSAATVAGYAVRASNLVGANRQRPIILPIVDSIEAGGYRHAPLTPRTAVLVEVGAPLPEGADAVMPLDDGLAVDDDVQFTTEARVHQNVRLAGSRVADGDQLVARGSVLTPRTLAVIAEVGHDKVLAMPRPRAVVLVADDTLKAPGLPLARLSESYDATSTLLAATLRDDGAQVFVGHVASSDPKAIGVALGEQLVRADLVLLVTRPTELLEAVLASQGSLDIAEVDALPGRQLFALVGEDRSPVLVVSPDAVPAYLAYGLVGRPLLQKLAGKEPTTPEATSAPVTHEVAADAVRTRLLLAHYSTRGVTPLAGDDAGAAELADANAVIVVPPAGVPIPAHGDVTCWLLD
ncbi:MAG TPA: gephyrin-like molybdotransferase Glp [Propionicimonas sp.]|nr:gephyrin-like molybdotransferase Glp [Propionicimonas sp.]